MKQKGHALLTSVLDQYNMAGDLNRFPPHLRFLLLGVSKYESWHEKMNVEKMINDWLIK